MNRMKHLHLKELNQKHDQTHKELRDAMAERTQARDLGLGLDVEARCESEVVEKKATLAAIEKEREPLLREYERSVAQFHLKLAVAGLLLSLAGNLMQWLNGP